MNTTDEKREFLKNSFEKAQGLFFAKISHKQEKMKQHLTTVIDYFLDENVEKTFSGLFISDNNQLITIKTKHKIFHDSDGEFTLEEEQLKKLFNSVDLPELKNGKQNLCVRFKIKHTNKNFYLIRNNERYSLSWGIDHKNTTQL